MTRFTFKKIILPNGLRILLLPQQGVAATALILVAAGSEYEIKDKNGLSHFLEHMVFKGTERRPEPGLTAAALDALGAEYNAFTGQEFTGYWAKAESRKLPELLELVSDLYLRPLLNEKEIEKERGVLIEELRLVEDTPTRQIHDIFDRAMYGDQPAGWPIGGTEEITRSLSRKDILDYRSSRYVTTGTVIAIAGDFKEKDAVKFIRSEFGHLPRKTSPRKKKAKETSGPKMLVRAKDSDQSHLILGVRTFSLADKRRYAGEILANILAGGMSSRLFMRIREKMGAAYYISGENSLFIDRGYLGLWMGANTEKLPEVIAAVLEECSRLGTELVGPAELKKAKDHLTGTFLLGLETSDAFAEFFAEQELLTSKIEAPDQIVRRLQAVSAEEVRSLARQIFRDKNLALGLIGRIREEHIRKLLHFPV